MTELTYGQVLVIGLLCIAADLVMGLFLGRFIAAGKGDGPITDRNPERPW